MTKNEKNDFFYMHADHFNSSEKTDQITQLADSDGFIRVKIQNDEPDEHGENHLEP